MDSLLRSQEKTISKMNLLHMLQQVFLLKVYVLLTCQWSKEAPTAIKKEGENSNVLSPRCILNFTFSYAIIGYGLPFYFDDDNDCDQT